MIFYFSGTGNSKWVAEQLAAKTDDTAINLTKLTNVPSIDHETIGIVFPIYAWGAPEPVIEFLSKLVGKPTFCGLHLWRRNRTCHGETNPRFPFEEHLFRYLTQQLCHGGGYRKR